MSFNPRARVGRDSQILKKILAELGFNPRARVGRDAISASRLFAVVAVSIHAPAWGATGNFLFLFLRIYVFQSTRPRGARHTFLVILLIIWLVSIHAPAWGATPKAMRQDINNTSFNPRARVGRDSISALKLCINSSFQSTRPRGARQTAYLYFVLLGEFQSTRPRGARLYAFQLYALHKNNSIELRKFKI